MIRHIHSIPEPLENGTKFESQLSLTLPSVETFNDIGSRPCPPPGPEATMHSRHQHLCSPDQLCSQHEVVLIN